MDHKLCHSSLPVPVIRTTQPAVIDSFMATLLPKPPSRQPLFFSSQPSNRWAHSPHPTLVRVPFPRTFLCASSSPPHPSPVVEVEEDSPSPPLDESSDEDEPTIGTVDNLQTRLQLVEAIKRKATLGKALKALSHSGIPELKRVETRKYKKKRCQGQAMTESWKWREANFPSYYVSRGCKTCGREEMERGCNGEGRIQGGIGAVPGFGWWPIKAYRPCPGFIASGGRYRRRGQNMDEVAFGREEKEDTMEKVESRKRKPSPRKFRR